MAIFNWLSVDGKLIFISRSLRSFAYGFLSIAIVIYLKALHFSSFQIGLLLSASIAGGAVLTFFTGRYSTLYGIKKMFVLSLAFSLAGVLLFIISTNYFILFIAALIAFISPSGRELGPILSLEHAYLPNATSAKNRTKVFSYLNIIANISLSAGTLIVSLPLLLIKTYGYNSTDAYRLLFMLYFLLNTVALILYTRINEYHQQKQLTIISDSTKHIIRKLSLLFALDAFAGGLVVSSLVTLWFHQRFDTSFSTISFLFFIAGLLGTFSFFVADKLAEKFGMIPTMVFTHIPGNLCLIGLAFSGNFYYAALLFLLRQFLSEMDKPVRQSYVMSVVSKEEQPVASSVTNIARLVAASLGPAIASKILLFTVLSPFVIAGCLKIIYDLSLFVHFKAIHPIKD